MVGDVAEKKTVSVAIASLAALLLLLGSGGCDRTPSTSEAPNNTSSDEPAAIRVLVVDDPDWANVLKEQWQSRATAEEISVHTATTKELTTARRLSADVVIYPARWLGELAERDLIQPVPDALLRASPSGESPAAIPVDDLLPTVRQCDVSWGRQIYAVTLGSSQLVLFYRPDIFTKLQLSVPQTWAEYQAVAEKLMDRRTLGDLAPAEDQPWSAALEPTADGWAGTMLLARAAAAIRSEGQLYTLFDVDNMTARIASPPLVESAGDMAKIAKLGDAKHGRLTPAKVRDAFFAGQCAMAITWPSAAETGKSKVPVAFAELPGSQKFFSFQNNAWKDKAEGDDLRTSLCAVAGRLVSVTQEARRSRSAFQFLAWLQSDDAANMLGPASSQTTLFTKSQLANPQRWVGSNVSPEAASQYAQVVESAFSRASWMPTVRIPGTEAYHAALDAAVRQTLEEPEKAQAAFDAAAKGWNDITKQYDLSRQRRAYQRSLGNDF
jgi:ABC-type glycerol-3-phosphate transport system substrate-binding protein